MPVIVFISKDIVIKIASWKARACGIFARVGDVYEIQRVSAGKNRVQSAFHVVIYLNFIHAETLLLIFIHKTYSLSSKKILLNSQKQSTGTMLSNIHF